jgi:hypothetical protein
MLWNCNLQSLQIYTLLLSKARQHNLNLGDIYRIFLDVFAAQCKSGHIEKRAAQCFPRMLRVTAQ